MDQNTIEETLPCLPIFLAGCAQLVVLAGHTYVTRLWCVLELFTFLQVPAIKRAMSVRLPRITRGQNVDVPPKQYS